MEAYPDIIEDIERYFSMQREAGRDPAEELKREMLSMCIPAHALGLGGQDTDGGF